MNVPGWGELLRIEKKVFGLGSGVGGKAELAMGGEVGLNFSVTLLAAPTIMNPSTVLATPCADMCKAFSIIKPIIFRTPFGYRARGDAYFEEIISRLPICLPLAFILI